MSLHIECSLHCAVFNVLTILADNLTETQSSVETHKACKVRLPYQSTTSLHTRMTSSCMASSAVQDYSVRLVGGDPSAPWHGLVEVYLHGQWGTICNTNWDDFDAAVVCRQLGYHGVSVVDRWNFFGVGEGTIHMSDVTCPSGATSLRECSYRVGSSCQHYQDASVKCDGGIRLRGGSVPQEGVVELYEENHRHWGALCAETWNDKNAAVTCRQLGYAAGGVAGSPSRNPDYQSLSRYLTRLKNFSCRGTELSLTSCPQSRYSRGSCTPATVVCHESGQPSNSNAKSNNAEFIMSTVLGSTVFVLVVACTMMLVVIRRWKSRNRTGSPIWQRMEDPSRTESTGQRNRDTPSNASRRLRNIFAISGSDSHSPEHAQSDPPPPPPYSPIPIPRVENPIVGREERYEGTRLPRCAEMEAEDFFSHQFQEDRQLERNPTPPTAVRDDSNTVSNGTV